MRALRSLKRFWAGKILVHKTGKKYREGAPLASSSSTSASCSAAMLNKAVTLYRFVFLLVRRRMLPGELGSVNVDMIGGWKGDLQVGG